MQPNSQRRVHDAEFKAQVLAACQQSGASVAAVALAHGLNVNLVRKWLVGRGLKRAGLIAPRTVACSQPSEITTAPPALQFVPVALAGASSIEDAAAQPLPAGEPQIHIELRRASARLSVRWPASQAQVCATWLRELAGMSLK